MSHQYTGMSVGQHLLFGVIAAIFAFSAPVMASAASYDLTVDKDTFVIGDTFNVDVKIASADVGINAAQATITYPNDILLVTNLDKGNSAFNFWLQGPEYANETGRVTFIGGSQNSISGKALPVLRITFKVKGAGPIAIIFSDGAVTASDGSGTNVLSAMNGLHLTSITKQDATFIKPPQIERPATPSVVLPVKPVITVPLYPEQEKWSNVSARFFVSWKLPSDVTAVAVALNKTPLSSPAVSEGLFELKEFAPLQDGVYYLHARFMNDEGWGKALHYRIAVDTLPPPLFKIDIAALSDNPTPTVVTNVEDALSGISSVVFLVDDKEVLQTASTSAKLPPVGPGSHVLRVKVIDRAGNSSEESTSFEITPLPTPIIEFLSVSATLEEPVIALGKSIPNAFIDVSVLNALQQEILKDTVESDTSGVWRVNLGQSLHSGKYTLAVTARDVRGALSYPTKDGAFRVRPQVVLSFGGLIDLSWLEIFLITLVFIIVGGGLAAWRYVSEKRVREAYKIVVSQDVEKFGSMLSSSLKELGAIQRVPEPGRSAKVASLVASMKDRVAKLKKYIGTEVSKMK
ncbi:MAG: hypothetical protein A2845_01055 [Candidatus Lloydbacteria bacterium RIFCSPHIGHO2_01_FULL_49_22]|uniref:Uncharacterized protein n=1 Tax=Candidatus Lloydbacteria bacterium RIFCSPHIGHO2_01_FULL_49_22 TaxID=1798658 RepID=A0A1G2CYM5_9BACT|nr:MAG: hypothetical protein A2845_01055 [Candidatus Lloydbacteria bacterium RIFCSPHIGHO2_01_FULL_49_22]OGZ09934.1 MAG: hypothetical protein A3C14_04425 [Candidatus Lloydbacteria bacterium RIFCSPHIGHO2_02_FULL_50_18]